MNLRKIIVLCAVSVVLLNGCYNKSNETPKIITENNEQEIILNDNLDYNKDFPVYRALAARMLSIVFLENDKSNETNFLDVDKNEWYYKYINDVCENEIMRGEGDIFNPMQPLTYKQAQIILKNLNISTANKNIEKNDVPVSYQLWNDMLFDGIKDKLSDYGVEKKELTIFATAGEGGMESWNVATDMGVMHHGGLFMDGFVDKTIEAYVKGNDIIAVIDIKDSQANLNEAYVKPVGDNIEVTFMYSKRILKNSANNSFLEGIYDLTVKDGNVISFVGDYKKINSILKKCSNGVAEIENGTKINLSDNMYCLKNGVETMPKKFISGGRYDFYIKNDKAVAVFNNRFNGLIRVVIGTEDFEGYYHSDVEIEGNFSIKNLDETVYSGKSINISQYDNEIFKNSNRIIITPVEGKIGIKSIKRNYSDYPVYDGNIEIEKTDNGYIVVNETDIENYVKGVVLSEMPESYGLTAVMAQAVCARSYAYNQFFSGKYAEYGADCDDSVMCQVYNNIPYTDLAERAVDNTKGLCIFYDNNVINACFFASSAGTTSNSNEVWADSDKSFPAAYKEYLSSRNNTGVNFNDENEALIYFKNTNAFAYDSWSRWFRWNVLFSKADIEQNFIKNIKTAYNSGLVYINANNISDDEFMSEPGEFVDIEVLNRGEGGNIMSLRLTFEKGYVDINTEYNIRTVLKPRSYTGEKMAVNLNDGTSVYNYGILPSAFFSFEKVYEGGKIYSVKLYGGGIGHGCGMSQNGAKYLAENGKTFEEILELYYKNTILKQWNL